jgi:hypothetical protein
VQGATNEMKNDSTDVVSALEADEVHNERDTAQAALQGLQVSLANAEATRFRCFSKVHELQASRSKHQQLENEQKVPASEPQVSVAKAVTVYALIRPACYRHAIGDGHVSTIDDAVTGPGPGDL